jgi:hypothetical protein
LNPRRTLIATLAVGAAMFAAGCGGGDDSTSSTGASGASGASGPSGSAALSKPDFIKQADAICKTGNKATDAAGQALGQNPSSAQVEQFVKTGLAPALQTEFDAIGKLTPPAGDEDKVQAILDAAQNGLDEIKSDPSKLTDKNDTSFDEANKLASAYGLKVCGQ